MFDCAVAFCDSKHSEHVSGGGVPIGWRVGNSDIDRRPRVVLAPDKSESGEHIHVPSSRVIPASNRSCSEPGLFAEASLPTIADITAATTQAFMLNQSINGYKG